MMVGGIFRELSMPQLRSLLAASVLLVFALPSLDRTRV